MKLLKQYILLVVALLLLFPVTGYCISVDNSTSAMDAAVSSLTWSHTVNSNTNGILLVGVSLSPKNVPVGSVTYNGLPLSLVGAVQDPTNSRLEIWSLLTPPTGPHNVVVTMSGGTSVNMIVGGSASFIGVDQTTPLHGGFTSDNGTLGLAPSVVLSTSHVDQVAVGAVAMEGLNVLALGTQNSLWGQIYILGLLNSVQGSGSWAQGTGGNVTMSWVTVLALGWSTGGVVLNPDPAYLPDAMIKNNGEADAAYLTPNLYETTASIQAKTQSVVNGTTATYLLKFANNGLLNDQLRITGTASGSNFTVQYLDDSSIDRTAAVTGAGYTTAALPFGGSRVWTLRVTPGATVVGGTSYPVSVTVRSVDAPTMTDQVKATTSSASPVLTMIKSADKASYKPGDDITYTLNCSNGASLSSASSIVVTDPVPSNTGFKIGGVSFNVGSSTLTAAYSYSNDSGATYAYTPVSGGCAAPAGYDYCVSNVKWTMAGSMPTNSSFSVGLLVRVK